MSNQKDINKINVKECTSMITSKIFIVLVFTFKPLIHFEFIFICGVIKASTLILLYITVQFSQYHWLKRVSFLHSVFQLLLLYINYLLSVGSYPGYLFSSIDYACFCAGTTLLVLCLLWLELPVLCWINVGRVGILVLFLIWEEILSGFHSWEWW